jgi:hypothetical protein
MTGSFVATIRRPLCVLTMLVAMGGADAARAQTLGLTPAEMRATFKPQQVVQFDLNVSNDGDTPIPMRASVMDLWYDPATNEKIFGAAGTLPRSAANWVAFVPPTFTLPPHGTGKVKVVITPPADAAGGSYAVLFVESKPELARAATPEAKPIFANVRLGALILLTAQGTEEFHIEVREAALTPPSPTRNLELVFQLENGSNSHVFPEARLAILNASQQVVARTEVETRRFFPGQKDAMKLTWAGTLPAGEYTGVLTIAYGKDKVYTQLLPLHVGSTDPTPPQ